MSSKTLHFLALNLLTLIAATTTVMASEPLDVPARNAVGPGFKLRFKKEAKIRVGMHQDYFRGSDDYAVLLAKETVLRFETEKGVCKIFSKVATRAETRNKFFYRRYPELEGKLTRVAAGREILVLNAPWHNTRGGLLEDTDIAVTGSDGQPLRKLRLRFAITGSETGTYVHWDNLFADMVCFVKRGAAVGLNSQLWVTLRELQEILGDSLEVLPEALEPPPARHVSPKPPSLSAEPLLLLPP